MEPEPEPTPEFPVGFRCGRGIVLASLAPWGPHPPPPSVELPADQPATWSSLATWSSMAMDELAANGRASSSGAGEAAVAGLRTVPSASIRRSC